MVRDEVTPRNRSLRSRFRGDPDMTAPPSLHAEIVVDLDAVRHNVRRLRELVPDTQLMVVVKADGYGHGMVEVARAARDAGATWLGVATHEEAVALRAAGDSGRVLCWMAGPGQDHRPAIAAGVDVSAYTADQLHAIAAAADEPARVQIKVDTGLSRGGAPRSTWETLFEAARAEEQRGRVRVTGVWSHLACSDEPRHPSNDQQEKAFREALDLADAAGLRPEVRHLANSAGALLRPSSRFDLVRLGIASYGLTPAPEELSSHDLGLRPAMTVRGRVVMAKDLAAGEGVSYGHTFVTDRPTHVALVPMGYGDGIPRHASNTAQVLVGGRRGRVLGRICMDQFVVEAPDHVKAGDEVVLIGPGDDGEPTAQEWADWCGTISYEVVTRMGGRQRRTWKGTE
jgi:alanine racemase